MDGSNDRSECTVTNPPHALMTISEKRDANLGSQLVHVRADDRRSLIHLPVSQQRALFATHKKQEEGARRAERTLQSRMELMGNKTLMKHYVSDVPGRSNARFVFVSKKKCLLFEYDLVTTSNAKASDIVQTRQIPSRHKFFSLVLQDNFRNRKQEASHFLLLP